MNLTVSVDINESRDKVWAAITDIEQCQKMITGIIRLTVLHKPSEGLVGLKWTETRKMFGKEASETMWIIESVEHSHYYTRAENHGAIYTTKLAVSDFNGQTRLEMSFNAEVSSFFMRVISKLMGVVVEGSVRKMLQQDLEDIKRYIEV